MSAKPQIIKENELSGDDKVPEYDSAVTARIAAGYQSILQALGENSGREGLAKTPERVAKALQFLTHGYSLDPAAILNSAKFREDYQQMVLVMCMTMRGIQKQHSVATTSAFTGEFFTERTRSEFMRLLS